MAGHVSESEPPENGEKRDSGERTNQESNGDTTGVHNKIMENGMRGLPAIDLSQCELSEVPAELLQLPHLEYIYLEGNHITSLPDNFFDCFTRLKWLDLRNNGLRSLPSTYIGRHEFLRNLLLENNSLRTLPLELGLVRTLNGLNISKNPLEFPPAEVIERGTQTVLAFLREILHAKSIGKIPAVPRLEDLKLKDSDDDSNSSDEWGSGSHTSSRARSIHSGHRRLLHGSSSDQSELLGQVMSQSAALHRPVNYGELKEVRKEKLKKAGAFGAAERQSLYRRQDSGSKGTLSQTSVTPPSSKDYKVDLYPEPPGQEHLDQRYIDERRLARLKEMKEKQDGIIQRRKDQEHLKDWRNESKRMQQKKIVEKRMKGKLDYEAPATQAPFGVEAEHLKMPSNEERIAHDVREKHEKIRQMTPESKLKVEQERLRRDKELESKIKHHTEDMQDRRRKPRGNPKEEMEAAKRELEIANELHKQLEMRRKQLEYRFTAFTGDTV